MNSLAPPFSFGDSSSLQPNQGRWAPATLRNSNRLNLPNDSAGVSLFLTIVRLIDGLSAFFSYY
jgi:hypothetical protein